MTALDDLFGELGIPDPVDELTAITGDAGIARFVFAWHRARILEHEMVQTEAQDWLDANAYSVLPDWAALHHILTGSKLQGGAA